MKIISKLFCNHIWKIKGHGYKGLTNQAVTYLKCKKCEKDETRNGKILHIGSDCK